MPDTFPPFELIALISSLLRSVTGFKFLVPSLDNFHPPFKQKNHKYFILMISLYIVKKGMFYIIPNNFSILLSKSLYFELSFSLLTRYSFATIFND